MTRDDRHVFSLFASSVRERFPEARIWAFGSRAKGMGTEFSDLDVCVVVPRLDEAVDQAIIDAAWEVGFEHDVVISTVTYSKEEFEQGPCSDSSLVDVVLREGVAA